MRRILSLILTALFILSFTPVSSFAQADVLEARLTVDEDSVIKPAEKSMFGFNTDAAWSYETAAAPGVSAAARPEIKKALDEYGFAVPMLRAFLHDDGLDWKKLIGAPEERTGSGYSRIYTYGLAEWLKSMLEINPDMQFTFTININDDASNLADFIRFLTLMPDDANAVGSDSVNWPAKRIEYGLTDPINLCCIELGNEYDNGCYAVTESNPTGEASSEGVFDYEKMQYYIDRCSEIIPAIRGVNPDVKLAVSGCSQPRAGGLNLPVEEVNWKQWNGTVIPELGSKVDYIVLHYYMSAGEGNFGYFWDYENLGLHVSEYVNKLPEGQRPKVFVSEYAIWRDLSDARDPELRDRWTDLDAALTLSELVNRFNNQTEVGLAAHHTFMAEASTAESYGGNGWGVLRPFDGGSCVLTAAGEYLRLAASAANGSIVSSKLSGNDYANWSTKYEDRDKGMITCTAFLEEDGYLNLLLVNRNNTYAQKLTFSADKSYCLESSTVLTSDGIHDNNNAANENLVYAKTDGFSNSDIFGSYTVPAKSIVLLKLRPSDKTFAGNTAAEISVNRERVKNKTAVTESGEDFSVYVNLFENAALANAGTLPVSIASASGGKYNYKYDFFRTDDQAGGGIRFNFKDGSYYALDFVGAWDHSYEWSDTAATTYSTALLKNGERVKTVNEDASGVRIVNPENAAASGYNLYLLGTNVWYTVDITAQDGSISWTVTDKSTNKVVQTGSYDDPEPLTCQGASVQLFAGGQGNTFTYFDNIKITGAGADEENPDGLLLYDDFESYPAMAEGGYVTAPNVNLAGNWQTTTLRDWGYDNTAKAGIAANPSGGGNVLMLEARAAYGDQGSKPSVTYNNLVFTGGDTCFSQAYTAVRGRIGFGARLTSPGEYKMTIGEGANKEEITLICKETAPPPAELVKISSGGGSGSFSLVVHDEAAFGKSAVTEVKSNDSGEICFWNIDTVKAYTEGTFTMPDWAPSGEYELSLTWDGGQAKKAFDYKNQNEAVSIVSLPRVSGSLANAAALKNSGTAEISLKSVSGESVNANVFMAFYNRGGNLVKGFVSETVTVTSSETAVNIAVPELPEDALYARLFVWENDTISPLTNAYILQEKEGDR